MAAYKQLAEELEELKLSGIGQWDQGDHSKYYKLPQVYPDQEEKILSHIGPKKAANQQDIQKSILDEFLLFKPSHPRILSKVSMFAPLSQNCRRVNFKTISGCDIDNLILIKSGFNLSF